MNQSLNYEIIAVMEEATDANLGLFLQATVTFNQRTNTVSATGQPNLSTWNPISGLTDMECMFAMQRPAIPNPTATVRTPVQFDTLTMYHILLSGYFPQILQSNQAVVTVAGGTIYTLEIMAVENDSQGTQTRLSCRVWSQ